MSPEKNKGPSLDPGDMLNTEPELIIDQLLGPGVTIIGSRKPFERDILQEQMALSLATGEDFLGMLKTIKADVLYVVHGAADLKAMKARRGSSLGFEVRDGWPKLSQGGMKELKNVLRGRQGLRVIFLGHFNMVKSSPKKWLQKINETKLEESQIPGLFDMQALRREVTEDDIRRLRNFAVDHHVSLVIGGGFSTKRVLYDIEGLGHRDTEIHIWKVHDGYELEVLPSSHYVRAMTWDLILDYENRFYSLRDEAKRQMKIVRAEASGSLALTQKEREIIDAMWDKGYMKMSDIEKASGIPHSTVSQRVNALQRREKGEWIFKVSKEYYVVNQYNKRDWVK